MRLDVGAEVYSHRCTVLYRGTANRESKSGQGARTLDRQLNQYQQHNSYPSSVTQPLASGSNKFCAAIRNILNLSRECQKIISVRRAARHINLIVTDNPQSHG